MPTVRTYQQQQQTAPLPTARRSRVPIGQLETPIIRAAPTAEAFGAQVGEVATRLGEGMYGQELEAQAREIREVKERQNRTAVFEADNKLSAWENQYLYDPQKGALNKKGKDAFGLPDTVSEDFEKVYGEIWQSLSNDDQRVAFEQLAHTRRKDVQATVMRHTSQQMDAFETSNFQSYLENSRSSAMSNYQDPLRINTETERTRTAVYNYGQDRGLGPEWIQNTTEKAVSAIHAGVVERYLAAGQDVVAKNYLENWKHEISGEDQLRLERPLEEGSLRGESQRAADSIARDAKPDATLTGLLDEAGKVKDPKVRDQVENRLRQWWIAKKQDEEDLRRDQAAAAKDAIDRTMQGLLNAIDRGQPRDMLGVHKLVDEISPGLWVKLDDKQRNVLESYAKKLVEKGKIETDPGTFLSLRLQAARDPEAFAKIPLGDYIHKLDEGDWKQLVNLQADILKGNKTEADKVLDGIRSNDRIISSALRQAGVDPDDKANKPRVDALWQRVDERVQTLQRITGKKATDEDLQKIVDDQLTSIVTEKGSWWNILPGGAPFSDISKRVFEIKLEDIPAGDRKQIEEALRSAGRAVTDDAVLNLYIATQQRLQKKK